MGWFEPEKASKGAASASAPVAGPVRRERIGWSRVLLGAAAYGLGLFGVGYLAITLLFENPLTAGKREHATHVRILARDGTLIAERGGAGSYIPLAMIPKSLQDAVIATEDHRFYDHRGLDLMGLARAGFRNLIAGHTVEGGSTITQQLAKNLYLGRERTFARKLGEAALALWIETRLKKSEILELYLNRVYFGGGAFGVEAASQRYFDKSARQLTLAESAVIAGLLKAPTKLSPAQRPDLAELRARLVLERMRETHRITDQQMADALRHPPHYVEADRGPAGSGAGYAVDLVLDRLSVLVGPEEHELVIETTLDLPLQRQAQAIIEDALSRTGSQQHVSEAALLLMDLSGGIKAVIGGRSYQTSQFNRAIRARRQPGSAFKPIVYLTALEHGYQPDTVVEDLPINVNGWAPRNDNGRFQGSLRLEDALAHSVNTVAVRLALELTPGEIIKTAHRLGLQGDIAESPTLALGTSETSLVELTGAYAVFGNGGHRVEPHVIRRVLSGDGRVVYASPGRDSDTIIAAPQAGAMNAMLEHVVATGTGRRAQLKDRPVAGKTGTTQDNRDAWFIGYTAQMALGVWVGNDGNEPMKDVMGGGLPAEIWRSLMTVAHAGLPVEALPGARPPVSPMAAMRASRELDAALAPPGPARRPAPVTPQTAQKAAPPTTPTATAGIAQIVPAFPIYDSEAITRLLAGSGRRASASQPTPAAPR